MRFGGRDSGPHSYPPDPCLSPKSPCSPIHLLLHVVALAARRVCLGVWYVPIYIRGRLRVWYVLTYLRSLALRLEVDGPAVDAIHRAPFVQAQILGTSALKDCPLRCTTRLPTRQTRGMRQAVLHSLPCKFMTRQTLCWTACGRFSPGHPDFCRRGHRHEVQQHQG